MRGLLFSEQDQRLLRQYLTKNGAHLQRTWECHPDYWPGNNNLEKILAKIWRDMELNWHSWVKQETSHKHKSGNKSGSPNDEQNSKCLQQWFSSYLYWCCWLSILMAFTIDRSGLSFGKQSNPMQLILLLCKNPIWHLSRSMLLNCMLKVMTFSFLIEHYKLQGFS